MSFAVDVFGPAVADVYLPCRHGVPWDRVERLDGDGVRVVSDLPNLPRDEQRLRRILGSCDAILANDDDPELALAADLPRFTGVHELHARRVRPYAFYIGRLERDFAHAREAIRTAVEAEAGIAFLWIDDGRHRTNVHSIRERTRQLLQHAAFVVADLTLGVESPERENPSRAHEIGMSLAYERPLLLSSQEPRRYPYFSIADLQMTFWETEDELHERVREWIRIHRDVVARRVLNYELRAARIAAPAFVYDAARRYVGPKTRTAVG